MKRKVEIFLLLFALGVLGITGCTTRQKKPVPSPEPILETDGEEKADFTCAVKAVDANAEMIEFYNTTYDAMESYAYSGATHILTKNGKELTAEQIKPGEIYDVFLDEYGKKILWMKEPEGITEVQDTKVFVNPNEKHITVQDITYGYTDKLLVLSGGRQITPLEVTNNDRVTFYGVRGKAYALVVTKGHGYIRPKNYKEFVGGTLTIEGETILPISEDMLLTVPEGTQKLSMENGDLTGSVYVKVKRNQVTNVDMSEYQSQVPDVARVNFDIHPEGAELYVNGSLTDAGEPLSLKYGNHSVKVVLEGYNDYSGVVNIQDPNPTIQINLAEETAEVTTDEEDEDSETSVTDKNDESDTSATEEKQDEAHTITVSGPSGAAVYINGTYKGEAPCNFTKIIGSLTLTLTKEGYETKSYTIEVSDDGKDITWSFPDLEKEDDEEGQG